MKKRFLFIPTLLLTVFAISAKTFKQTKIISTESLLNEMVNRDSVAIFPQTNYRLKQ